MTSWQAARQAARDAAKPLEAVEVPLADALGTTLAEPLTAHTPMPAFDTSAMDGYAVAGDGPWTLVGHVRAGGRTLPAADAAPASPDSAHARETPADRWNAAGQAADTDTDGRQRVAPTTLGPPQALAAHQQNTAHQTADAHGRQQAELTTPATPQAPTTHQQSTRHQTADSRQHAESTSPATPQCPGANHRNAAHQVADAHGRQQAELTTPATPQAPATDHQNAAHQTPSALPIEQAISPGTTPTRHTSTGGPAAGQTADSPQQADPPDTPHIRPASTLQHWRTPKSFTSDQAAATGAPVTYSAIPPTHPTAPPPVTHTRHAPTSHPSSGPTERHTAPITQAASPPTGPPHHWQATDTLTAGQAAATDAPIPHSANAIPPTHPTAPPPTTHTRQAPTGDPTKRHATPITQDQQATSPPTSPPHHWHATNTLTTGQAVGIATGAPVPRGTDAVLPVEHTARTGLTVVGEIQVGRHIRRAGEDCEQGRELLPQGTAVSPAILGLAAAVGHDVLRVHRRPRVAVVLTGDEVVRAGRPGVGQVRDAIGPVLPGVLAAAGADLVDVVHVPDQATPLVEALRRNDVDVVVVGGATSKGPADHLRTVLAELGADVRVAGVECRPGHPQLLAVLPEGPCVVGLPGNPFAALAACLTLVVPLVGTLAGRSVPPVVTAELRGDVAAHPRDTRLVPVVLTGSAAVPVGHDRPGTLWGAALADALAVVPPGWAGGPVELLHLSCW